MLKIKSKKKLKKLIARARMKRVQRIMAAVKTHKKITEQKINLGLEIANKGRSIGGNPKTPADKKLKARLEKLRGKISSARKRSRDLWLNRVG